MAAAVLMLLSAAIFFALGTLHLIYTFFGSKLTPRDPALQARMSQVSPVITKETDMWRCWVGFNASHSLAGMLFGLIYGYLAVAHASFLFSSPYLLAVGLLLVSSFVALANADWFSNPIVGVSVSRACYLATLVL
jgi:hypothetical protein